MNKKYKATGFTRLIIFLLLFAPIAYLAAAYFQGENGVNNIKDFINIQPTLEQQITRKKQQIKQLEIELNKQNNELQKLQKQTANQ